MKGEIIGKNALDADTIYRSKKRKEFLEEFFSIQEEIVSKLKKERIKRILVFIDKHEIPWYDK